ncbi:MAG: efflux RND transporter periplasmic adaptor subunit, partial [Deltaproteobacteria bacterium]|nr:efflux RND transporter periplasmic adaptor subunit [Deltaproteobacteria bacterium]
MRRIILPLVLLLIFSGMLYGLGLPPFRKSEAVNSQPRREGARAQAVELGEVRRGTVNENIGAVGSLTASRYVSLAPKISGRVERVLVHVGDRVKVGQLIAQLDPRELEEQFKEAEASLKVSEATLKGKQAELQDLKRKLERAKRLYEKKFIARQELDTLDSEMVAAAAQVELTRAQIVQMKARLANAKLQLSETRLTAPFSAYVEKRLVDPGAMVNAGTPIASLVDIDRVKVVIPIVETDYPRITVGQDAAVTLDAYPSRGFKGKVLRVTPVLSQETRTGEVEIEVDNSSGRLKPGMFARVEIAVNQRRDALLVPEGSLVKTPFGHGVFRVAAGGSKNP